VRTLVTGANGFVGRVLTERLVAEGHSVVAACGADCSQLSDIPDIDAINLELTNPDSVRQACVESYDAVVHLAGISSGTEARRNPQIAWNINATGTALLTESISSCRDANGSDPTVLIVSTAEVYGAGDGTPRRETDLVSPASTYAASKLAAETAALAVYRRTGLKVVIARAFPHSGAGQDDRFVLPAFASRVFKAKAAGETRVPVGNLNVVRECMHVGDVVAAYLCLIESGRPGEVYNVASGTGISLLELFDLVKGQARYDCEPKADSGLMRAGDIDHLVGDSSKIERETGWRSVTSIEEVIAEVVGAEAQGAQLD